jgi:hypothetical protein
MTRRRSLPVHGLGKVLFCHATPRDDEEVVLVDSRLDRWREVLSGLDTDIHTVVCGHTHMPFVRLAHGRLVINPGSIGMPYGRAGAHWALLGPGVELRSTAFDIEAAITQVTQDSAGIVRPAAAQPPGGPPSSLPTPADRAIQTSSHVPPSDAQR